jgi:hypothetical protein
VHQDKWTNQWPMPKEPVAPVTAPNVEPCECGCGEPGELVHGRRLAIPSNDQGGGAVMTSFGYDVCDGDGCGERSNRFPFPHAPGCKYGPDQDDVATCLATFREDPMPDTAYCGERGHHGRHTAWQGSDYYAWLDGDEGAGWDPLQ